MKIWIDISSPPHVNFFIPFIKKFQKDVIVTARDFGTIKGSLDRFKIKYKIIGSHGKTKEERLIKHSERVKELTKFISRKKPDVGLSKHSVECPKVCYGLDIPNVSVLDHETATIQNNLIVPLSDIVITPSFIPKSYLRKFGARKIMQFYGVSEYVNFNYKPSKEILNELGLSKDRIILSRSEPFLSSHVFHKSNLFPILKEVLEKRDDVQVVFLPRNRTDEREFSKLDVIIPKKEVDTLSLYKFIDLMIGAGCCMNREACLAGCPTISIYPDKLPAVDKFLINSGLMKYTLNKNQAVKWIMECINNGKIEKKKLEEIIKKFEDPYKVVMKAINMLVS